MRDTGRERVKEGGQETVCEKCVRKRLCVKTCVRERLTVSDESAGVIELAQSLLPIGVRRGVQRLYVYVYVYVHMY